MLLYAGFAIRRLGFRSQLCRPLKTPSASVSLSFFIYRMGIIVVLILLPPAAAAAAAAAAKSLQSCPTLCDPIDSSPLGSSVPGILQARTLEWVAISFSN